MGWICSTHGDVQYKILVRKPGGNTSLRTAKQNERMMHGNESLGPQKTENNLTTSVSISFLRLLLHGVMLQVLAYLLLYEIQKWWRIQVTQRDANGHIC
jgi:hypothetical protein